MPTGRIARLHRGPRLAIIARWAGSEGTLEDKRGAINGSDEQMFGAE